MYFFDPTLQSQVYKQFEEYLLIATVESSGFVTDSD